MILTGCTPRLRADNYLHSFIALIDGIVDAKITVKQFIQKMRLIVIIHENVLFNVEQAQKNKRRPMLLKKGSKPLKDWLLDRQWLR
jgi:hypothetical protein